MKRKWDCLAFSLIRHPPQLFNLFKNYLITNSGSFVYDLNLIDFLVGVDANDGVGHLVRDLIEVTPDRSGLEDLK